MASISKKKTAIAVGSQIAGIALVLKTAKTKKAKVAGIAAILAGGEVAGYLMTRHSIKKFDPNADLSVKDYYTGLYDAISNGNYS